MATQMEWKIELVMLGVSDVDASIAFYRDQVGFHLDVDQVVDEHVRFVQLTPPGSACSIAFGTGITPMEPGGQKGIQVVVPDAAAAREKLLANGVRCTELDPMAWGTFVYFTDPDGNAWILQERPAR